MYYKCQCVEMTSIAYAILCFSTCRRIFSAGIPPMPFQANHVMKMAAKDLSRSWHDSLAGWKGRGWPAEKLNRVEIIFNLAI